MNRRPAVAVTGVDVGVALPVTAIAAMAVPARAIGTGDRIPWDVPEDRRFFRAYTAGKALLLGRRTFLEMAGWFDGHRPVVLTRDRGFRHPEARAVVHSVESALAQAAAWGEPELVVCGGAEVYAAALPVTGTVLLTEIEIELGSNLASPARFPPLPEDEWAREVTRTLAIPAGAGHGNSAAAGEPGQVTFARYRRRKPADRDAPS